MIQHLIGPLAFIMGLPLFVGFLLIITGEVRIDWSWFKRKKGRHRGKYMFRMLWPHNVFLRGQHRGRYVEKPEWKATRVTSASKPATYTITFTPDPAIHTPPPLPPTGAALKRIVQEREREFREVVRDELASTPIYTGLKFGGWGDLDVDRASPAPVCDSLSA